MTQSKKPTIFSTVKALSETRPLMYADIVEQDLPYEAFMVNRAFSLSEDTTIAASIMNLHSWMDKDQQAMFYIHTIRPRRRFEKWPKTMEQDAVNTIAKYYGMSRREALLHVQLHSPEQLNAMCEVLSQGAEPSRI
jgi:hypothetical protein